MKLHSSSELELCGIFSVDQENVGIQRLSVAIQGNLNNKDTIGTTASCPVYGGVPTLEDSNVHISM